VATGKKMGGRKSNLNAMQGGWGREKEFYTAMAVVLDEGIVGKMRDGNTLARKDARGSNNC